MTITKSLFVAAICLITVSGTISSAETRPQRIDGERVVDREAGHVSNRATIQTRRGQAVTTLDRSYDAETRSAVRTRTITGANGATAAEVREVEQTDTGYQATTTYTDFRGRTASRSASSGVEDGVITRTRGAIYRNGESANVIAIAERTDDGYSRSRELETSTGFGGSLNVEGTRTENGGTIDKVVTNASGEVVGTKITTLTNGDESANRTTVVTNSSGDELVYSRTGAKD